MSDSNNALKPGRYRHYKGRDYQVIDIATHSEDMSQLVVYRPLYGEGKLWVRPLSMFTETVTLDDGTQVPRFAFVE
ncbi:DUF1653 domain-containing protein [Alteromonas sp. a30]|uniref:DUF1653 domain-containing protein n=1 Tax=Alteromonas sp. a30 TaxID=2730917 RepID=UPI00227F1599|nr:DUF1653 domain-containing protein [Alteromonas sp. a30]MCY7296173.1 DUF1653 domain-containing protein [Alteromonas sp. a30]